MFLRIGYDEIRHSIRYSIIDSVRDSFSVRVIKSLIEVILHFRLDYESLLVILVSSLEDLLSSLIDSFLHRIHRYRCRLHSVENRIVTSFLNVLVYDASHNGSAGRIRENLLILNGFFKYLIQCFSSKTVSYSLAKGLISAAEILCIKSHSSNTFSHYIMLSLYRSLFHFIFVISDSSLGVKTVCTLNLIRKFYFFVHYKTSL